MPAEERPPIPWTPELNDPKWQPVYGEQAGVRPGAAVCAQLQEALEEKGIC
jgi:hypothetical protein